MNFKTNFNERGERKSHQFLVPQISKKTTVFQNQISLLFTNYSVFFGFQLPKSQVGHLNLIFTSTINYF